METSQIMPSPILCRQAYKVAGVTIWVEVAGRADKIEEIRIDAAGGQLSKKGIVTAKTPLGKKADKAILAYCANPRKKINLPLAKHDLIPSQQEAMDYLSDIPLGEVRTYKEQAQAVSRRCRNGFNARNAGNANRGNHYPLAIPCHRIIRSDGNVGGFMGSTQTKAQELKLALLRHEGAIF